MSTRSYSMLILAFSLITGFYALDAQAQGRRGGGFRMGRLRLAEIDEVRTELKVTDAQAEKLNELRDAREGDRRGGGFGGGFDDASPEEIRARAAERAVAERTALAGALEEQQLERLEQIFVQTAGANALADPHVIETLGIEAATQAQLFDAIDEGTEVMYDQMRELFQSGGFDRDTMRARIGELRAEFNKSVLAMFGDDQRESFAQLQGEPFDMPESAFWRRGGRSGGRSNRPKRPARPPRPSS